MPLGNGTGPAGKGSGTGRGMGRCRGIGRSGRAGRKIGSGGRGRIGGQGAGLGGNCICPQCGKTMPHKAGTPCYSLKCPDCGNPMNRQ